MDRVLFVKLLLRLSQVGSRGMLDCNLSNLRGTRGLRQRHVLILGVSRRVKGKVVKGRLVH